MQTKRFRISKRISVSLDFFWRTHFAFYVLPWISVKDELPKEDGVYYVGNIKNGWKGEMTFRNGLWHTAGYQSEITHWMPIPPLDKEV